MISDKPSVNSVKGILCIIRPVNVGVLFLTLLAAYYLLDAYSKFSVASLMLVSVPWLMVLMAGNVINDIYDYAIDRVNRAERPLPSGTITLSGARWLYLFLVLSSLPVAFLSGPFALLQTVFFHNLLFFYSVYLKRTKVTGNIVVSFATGFSFFYAALSLHLSVHVVLIPATFAFLVNMARELVKDIEDYPADSKFGIATLASVRNGMISRYAAAGFAFMVIVLTFFVYFAEIYRIEFFLICAVLVNPLLIYGIRLLLRKQDEDKLGLINKLLKVVMILGTGGLLLAR